MSWVEGLILGIVQGVTEFLPISSSAHLLVLPPLLDWRPGGLAFDALLHAGTWLALAVYFRSDLARMFRRLASAPAGEPRTGGRPGLALAAGTVPIVLAGAFGKSWIESELRIPGVTIFNLAMFGLILGAADGFRRGSRTLESITVAEGCWIGLAQALALAPGVSRSGVTITAGLLLGLSRVEAARFGFLLGIPAIGAAAAAEGWDWLNRGGAEASAFVLLIGVTSAFVSGWLCIKYFLRFLERGSLLWFTAYRCCLAAGAAYLLL